MKDMVGIIIMIAFFVYACSPSKLQDRPDYKKGYEAGYKDGVWDGTAQTCNQAMHLKDSIYDFLKQSGVCP